MLRPVLALVCLSLAVPVSAAKASEASRVQRAYTQWRSGLRHQDGDLACYSMTLRARNILLGELADLGFAGQGCVAAVQQVGRLLYRGAGPARFVRVGVRGKRATGHFANGSVYWFIFTDSTWLIDRPPRATQGLWP